MILGFSVIPRCSMVTSPHQNILQQAQAVGLHSNNRFVDCVLLFAKRLRLFTRVHSYYHLQVQKANYWCKHKTSQCIALLVLKVLQNLVVKAKTHFSKQCLVRRRTRDLTIDRQTANWHMYKQFSDVGASEAVLSRH